MIMKRLKIFIKVLVMKKSSTQEPTGSSSYEAMVAAQSRALERMSREIAEEIKNLSQ